MGFVVDVTRRVGKFIMFGTHLPRTVVLPNVFRIAKQNMSSDRYIREVFSGDKGFSMGF